MERNNIFDFATSELSQDAFICWCLNWLNYKGSELRALAVDLLKEFGEEDVSDNQEILIKRQFKKIDILVVLKGLNRVYIIEDKVHSSESKDQIGGYKGKIKELGKDEKKDLGIDENIEVKTVYFKTGFHFSPDKNVKANKIITGKMFKEILEKYRNKNEILDNYYEYLVEKLRTQENEKDYLECKAESHWDWNIAKSNIAQYCFLKEMFSEERVKSFKNKGNGPVVSQYNLLEKEIISYGETGETFRIFWRVDTLTEGTYLRLSYYYIFKNRKDSKTLNYKEISEIGYNIVHKKIYDIIEEYQNELPKIYKIKKCNYKEQNEIPILHINLKECIKSGKDEMNKLINEVKKLHEYLQNENFE